MSPLLLNLMVKTKYDKFKNRMLTTNCEGGEGDEMEKDGCRGIGLSSPVDANELQVNKGQMRDLLLTSNVTLRKNLRLIIKLTVYFQGSL